MIETFHNHFEISPLEVLSSVEKMCQAMEKMKTTAAFVSANTTYGFSNYTRVYILLKKNKLIL